MIKINKLIGLSILSMLYGCHLSDTPNDPFEEYNRALYDVHHLIEEEIYLPVYGVYQATIPLGMRIGINNMTDNILEISNVINDVLQGDIAFAISDLSRFAINSTIGVFGFFDFASVLFLPKHEQSFANTLALWGTDPGPFIVIPGIGAGFFANHLSTFLEFSTVNVLDPSKNTQKIMRDLILVQKFNQNGDDLLIKRATFDPYITTRNMALQNFNNAKNPASYEDLQLEVMDEQMMLENPDFFEEDMDYIDDTSTDPAQSTPEASLTIYTRENCGDCEKSIKLLQDLAINFVEINLTKHPEEAKVMSEKSGDTTASPQIFDADHFIGGYQALAKRYAPENKSDASE